MVIRYEMPGDDSWKGARDMRTSQISEVLSGRVARRWRETVRNRPERNSSARLVMTPTTVRHRGQVIAEPIALLATTEMIFVEWPGRIRSHHRWWDSWRFKEVTLKEVEVGGTSQYEVRAADGGGPVSFVFKTSAEAEGLYGYIIAAGPGPVHWRSANDFRTTNTDEYQFERAERYIPDDAYLDGDPCIELVLSPIRLDLPLGGYIEHPLAMLAAARSVVLVHEKGRLVFSRVDFLRYGTGLWRDSGPYYEVRTDHATEGRIVFVFRTPREADALAAYFDAPLRLPPVGGG